MAIDGPAVSGKSSVGKAFASRIGYRYLDTGLMYRAATWNAVQNGVDVSDLESVAAATAEMRFSVSETGTGGNSILVNDEDVTRHLHSVSVDAVVSAVSAVGRVREIMVAEQRRLASEGGVVMVGRDIGTVVLPEAPLKIYLTATARTRAERRYKDFVSAGEDVDFEEVLKSMEERDRADSSRANSPLRPAEDAKVVDTDQLTMDEVVDCLFELLEGII
ncbi:MAG: cytidylate kinase [Chloroflexi bacterium]|nr:cytidylate kinase [Chloroflexota bacterium]